MPALQTIVNGTVISGCPQMTCVHAPELKELLYGYLVSGCTSVTCIDTPKLTKIAGGWLVHNCPGVKRLIIDSLSEILGGNVVYGCHNVSEVTLPNVTEFRSGSIYSVSGRDVERLTINMPRVKRFTGCCTDNTYAKVVEVFLPECEYLAVNGTSFIAISQTTYQEGIIHLGAIEDGSFYFSYRGRGMELVSTITVGRGFRSALDVAPCTGLTPDSFRDIIANLGDNIGRPVIRLNLGATNLAKLTDEDIAMATAKNYTVS